MATERVTIRDRLSVFVVGKNRGSTAENYRIRLMPGDRAITPTTCVQTPVNVMRRIGYTLWKRLNCLPESTATAS